MFLSLHAGRGAGANGPNPLSYSEIKAWCDLCHEDMTPWELDVVKRLDAAWMSAQMEGDNG